MKKFIAFLFCFAIAASVFAVTPVPYTEVVTCSLRMQGDGSVAMTIHDESGTSPFTWTWTTSVPVESAPVSAVLRPGKKYSITYGGNGTTYSSWLSFIAPEGYQVYVDHVATNMMPIGVQTGSYNRTLTIELRPVVQNASPMPLGDFSGVQLGKSVTWQVGLGTLFGGRNAGRLYFKEYDLSGSPATRSKLYVAVANSTSEVWTINDGPSNQTLRQVITPLSVIDLLDDAGGGYWIRFFAPGQAEGSPGNPFILYGSPWKTIRVQSPAANQLKITETEGSAVRVSHLTLSSGSVPSGNYTWTLQEGDGSTWLRTTTQASSTTGITATGGNVTTAGGYTIHTFTSSGTFNVLGASTGSTVDALVVGGGGGGGSSGYGYGAGGGAGGMITGSITAAVQAYTVTVGAGGAANTNGSSSTFSSFTAVGGGKGGGGAPAVGGNGGSGGGAQDTVRGGVAGTGTSGQGNAGGVGSTDLASYTNCGGGGGAGAAGGNANGGSSAGSGGTGLSNSFSGSSVIYAGGGGGYAQSGTQGSGGTGGGGAGAAGTGVAGTANRGGGGGGSNGTGGAGGSGVVIIRYPTPTSVRNVVEIVRTGGTGGTIVAKTKYRFENVGGWGEELVQVTADPDSAALATTYTYHTNSANLGNFRRVRSMTSPTGSWSAQEYYDDWDKRGQLKYQYAPHLDSPSTVTLDPAQGHSVYYEYTADWAGRHSRPTLRQEKTNNIVTAKTTWSHGDITPPSDWPREYAYENSYRDATNYQTSYSERFRADSWPTIAGVSTVSKGAGQTQTSWGRVNGYYDPSTGAFAQGQSISHVRDIWVHGSTSSSGATAVSSWDGHSFSTVYLVANKSTMDAVISASGGTLLRKEKWVYTGSGFSLLNWENYTYNDQIRLTSQVASNGATVTNTYSNGLLTSTVGVDGTETQFTHDLLWRTATAVKKGASSTAAVLTGGYSYPAQGDITTTNTYDGANRVTQQVVSGGSLSLTSSGVFDLAGRPTSQTAPGSYTTSFGYSSGGKIVTTTLPGGATKITETHLDGRTKSVTGTGVVHEDYLYNLNSEGRREIIRRQSSVTMDYTYRDWLDRNILKQVPSPSGSGYTDHHWYYNSSGQLWKESRTGSADTLYQYDTLGRMFRSGLDVNANGSLDLASSDRINETNSYYYLESGISWWARNQTYVYSTDGSATAIKVSDVLNQLSGFSSGRLAQTNAYDVNWNCTITSVDVDRSNKKLTSTTDTPDSSTNAVSIAYNGLAVEARDTVGVIMRYEHDALGRQNKSIDPRTGATTTAFVSGTNLVSTVTDPASVVQATYAYDSAGRMSSVKNALNKYVYTGYTTRNEVYRQWGDTTYPVEYGYDSHGRWTTMKTFRGGSGWTGSTWPGSPGTADTTTWAYHAATGLVTSKTDAASKVVSYTYTQAGQIYTRTWARGVVTTYGYSGTTGELTGVTYSDSTPALGYTYNRLGQQATVTDYTGTRTFTYNLAGTLELQREDLPSFFGSRRLTYGYDTASGAKGRPNAFQLGTSGNPAQDQSVTYGYAANGRFNALSAGGQSFSYGYVTNSHLLGTIVNSGAGFTDTRVYDPYHDWVDSRTTAISSTTKAAFAYTQDNLGRVVQSDQTGDMFSRYGNGSQGLKVVYGYDDRSQVTSETTYLGGTSTVLTGRTNSPSGFAYDNIGNRLSTFHNGDTANYTVNALNQYTQRTVPGYFDVAGAAGSGATVTVNGSSGGVYRHGEYFFKAHGMANSPNPVYSTLTVSDGTTSANVPAFTAGTPQGFTYDDDGNLTNDGRWTYSYDAENRLAWLETASAAIGAGHPKIGIQFAYDHLGRRIRKVDYSWSGSSWVIGNDRRFLYNGWNQIAEYWGAYAGGAFVSTYSRHAFWGLDLTGTMTGAGGVGGLLMVQEGGNTYLPAYDGNGNVHAMIKASDGSIAAAYEYDAFGNTLRESGPYAASNPFRFSTKYTDTETSLVYYGLRYYSPSLGRFINRDPISESGGLNLYGFCGNNGVNRWDYLGMIAHVRGSIQIGMDDEADLALRRKGKAWSAGDVNVVASGGADWDTGGWVPGQQARNQAFASALLNNGIAGIAAANAAWTAAAANSIENAYAAATSAQNTSGVTVGVGSSPAYSAPSISGPDIGPVYGGPAMTEGGLTVLAPMVITGSASNNAEQPTMVAQLAPWGALFARPPIVPRPVIPPELLETTRGLSPRNRVTLPDGRRIDLEGKSHFNKDLGQPIETPHTAHPKPPNPAPYQQIPPGHQQPVPSSIRDILDALNHLLFPNHPTVVPVAPPTQRPLTLQDLDNMA